MGDCHNWAFSKFSMCGDVNWYGFSVPNEFFEEFEFCLDLKDPTILIAAMPAARRDIFTGTFHKNGVLKTWSEDHENKTRFLRYTCDSDGEYHGNATVHGREGKNTYDVEFNHGYEIDRGGPCTSTKLKVFGNRRRGYYDNRPISDDKNKPSWLNTCAPMEMFHIIGQVLKNTAGLQSKN